jgi:hypothetical protein
MAISIRENVVVRALYEVDNGIQPNLALDDSSPTSNNTTATHAHFEMPPGLIQTINTSVPSAAATSSLEVKQPASEADEQQARIVKAQAAAEEARQNA